MTESSMFAQAPSRAAKTKQNDKTALVITLIAVLAGLAWGVFTALPLTIEPSIEDAATVLKDGLWSGLIHLVAIMAVYLVVCMVARRALGVVSVLLVAAAAFATPIAAPFAVEAVGGVIYAKERAVLSALDADTDRAVAENQAKLAAADLEKLILPDTFSKRDFKAYDARVQSYRGATEALKQVAAGREEELRSRLAQSSVSPQRQAAMLERAKADMAAQAGRDQELYDLRVRAADNVEEAMDMLQARPDFWRIWYGQLAFGDPQMGADFSRKTSAAKGALVALRRLEGKMGVIGVTAQKRAS